MAAPFLIPIDLNKNEIQNPAAHNLATDPGTPAAGQFYFNTTDKTFRFYTGTAWVVLGRLDQISAPTAAVGLNGQRMTNAADPIAAQDLATRNYVDSVAQGIEGKAGVRAATTAALAITARTSTTLTIGGTTLTVDGIAMANGDRVLVKDATTGTGAGAWDNGIYSVSGIGTSVALTRTTDMDTWTEVPGAFVFVEQGTVNADSGWLSSANQGGTLGTTAITWVQFSQAGTITASNVNTAGVGVFKQKTGTNLEFRGVNAGSTKITVTLDAANNEIDIDVAEANLSLPNIGGTLTVAKGGTGATTAAGARTALGSGATGDALFTAATAAAARATLGAGATGDSLFTAATPAAARTTLGTVGRYAATIGNGSLSTIAVNHALNSTDPIVQVFEAAGSKRQVFCEVQVTDANNVALVFAVAPATNALRVVVLA